MFRIFFLTLLISLSPLNYCSEDIPDKALKAGMSATVRVKIENSAGGGAASGVLVKSGGNTGLVLTNAHVVKAGGPVPNVAADVTFYSGTAQSMTTTGQLLLIDETRDLAVVKVEAKDLPKPLDFDFNPVAGENVYIFGFPMLSGTFAITCFHDVLGDAANWNDKDFLRIWGKGYPGNSGGPALDKNGKIIGINTCGSVEGGYMLAIPALAAQKFLARRIYRGVVEEIENSNGTATLRVSVPLDGFDSPTAVEVTAEPVALYNAASGVRITNREEGTLHWPAAAHGECEIRENVANGELKIRGDGRTKVDFLLAIRVNDGSGLQLAGYLSASIEFSRNSDSSNSTKKPKRSKK